MDKITATYIRDLAVVYHRIDNRGMLFDEVIMQRLDSEIKKEVDALLYRLSNNWHSLVYLGADKNKANSSDSINLNSPVQLLAKLKLLGYDIPKVRKKNKETYEIEYKESVEELVLRKIFAETGSPDIQCILEVRELNTLRTRYVNARRLRGVFYSCYNTAGTITGRRGCKKHTFGYGGNAQTFPKHYSPNSPCYVHGQDFLRGVIARPGKIFFHSDQYSAEDWPISALSENTNALDELRNHVDRHTNLASYIFGIPVHSRTSQAWKDSLERYLGKKTRYAYCYGMRGYTMSDSLAKEGYSKSAVECDTFLTKADEYDPSIERVFHQYIRDQLYKTQVLRNPFGRECQFLGLRQNDSNYKVFNEAYSIIPQGTVADNTGFAVYEIEQECDDTVLECHDSITQEIYNDIRALSTSVNRTRKAFDRDIQFHNGLVVNIPIESEIGFNLKDTVKLKDFTEESIKDAFYKLNDEYRRGNRNEVTKATLAESVHGIRESNRESRGI